MIVVKLELWPSGREDKAREIGRTYIANVGGTFRRGNYRAAVCRRGSTVCPRDIYTEAIEAGWISEAYVEAEGHPKATRTARVEDYPRLSYNVWRLVIRALRACFPEEK